MNNWISVEDRLPNHGDSVLIFTTETNVKKYDGSPEQIHSATFFKGKTLAELPSGPWLFYDEFGNNKVPYGWKQASMAWFGQDVTHWQDLPEAPK